MATANFNQTLALKAVKYGVRWLSDGSYALDLQLSDGSGRGRGVFTVSVSADGLTVSPAGVALPASFLADAQTFAADADAFVAALAAAGKVGV